MNISLIIPAFNEETNIQKGVLDKIGNFTKDNHNFSEVIIVDDGSTDNTKKLIKEEYLGRFPKFKLIENKHQGKAFSIITGVENSRGNYTMFSDIDLATPIEESEKLIREAGDKYKIVIGSRTSSREGAPLSRKLLALGFIYIRNILFGFKGIKDTQCGFKLFEKKSAEEIIKRLLVFKEKHQVEGPSVSAAFDLEFLFLANKIHAGIKEVPVHWKHVETKNVNFLKDAVETLKDMARVKYYDLTRRYEI